MILATRAVKAATSSAVTAAPPASILDASKSTDRIFKSLTDEIPNFFISKDIDVSYFSYLHFITYPTFWDNITVSSI